MPRQKTIPDAHLLEVARARFLADGVGARTRQIAADAGVSEGVLFQRFGTKEELFFRAMRLPAPSLAQALASALRAKTHLRGLYLLASSALDFLREIMPAVLLVLSHPAQSARLKQGSNQAGAMLAEASELHAAFRKYLEAVAERGWVTARDPAAVIGILVSTLLSRAIHEQIGFADPADTQQWLEEALAAIDQGLSGGG